MIELSTEALAAVGGGIALKLINNKLKCDINNKDYLMFEYNDERKKYAFNLDESKFDKLTNYLEAVIKLVDYYSKTIPREDFEKGIETLKKRLNEIPPNGFPIYTGL